MYKLLRPHHSIFLVDNEQFYEQFMQYCEQNPQLTILFGTVGQSEIMFQWRLAFNTWIYLQTPEESMFEHSERVMYYPTIQLLVHYFQKNMTISVFKNNYKDVHYLVFIASLFIVEACMSWYESVQDDVNMTKVFSESLMETDVYQIFKNSSTSNGLPLPKVLVESIGRVFKDFKHKIDDNEQLLIENITEAINESKKLHSFLQEVSSK